MKIHVYDTYVTTTAGQYLHFDVLVNEQNTLDVSKFAESYLHGLGIQSAQIKSNSCQFCHSEMANLEVQSKIQNNGHYILPLSGC